jgi:hypothetical protein
MLSARFSDQRWIGCNAIYPAAFIGLANFFDIR